MSGGITLATLRRTIPQFDAALDVQIGDWVLVLPFRRRALLDALSRESAKAAATADSNQGTGEMTVESIDDTPLDLNETASVVSAVRSSDLLFPKLHALLARHRTAITVSAEPREPAASSSVLGERSTTVQEGRHNGENNSGPPPKRARSPESVLGAVTSPYTTEVEYEEDDTLFYLHIPTRTLTTRCPAVFGGSDYVEWVDGTSWKRFYVNWITGECSDTHLVLAGPPMPRWITEVAERAEREFDSWQRRTIKRSTQ